MLQHVIKWAVFAAAWRQAKPYFAGTVLAVLSVLLIDILHAEFVEYIRLSKDLDPGSSAAGPGSGLLISFAVKWSGFALIAVAWFLYGRRVYRQHNKLSDSKGKQSKSRAVPASAKSDAAIQPTPAELEQQQKDDAAFDFLRGKGKLQGRGDKILGNQSGKQTS